MLSNPAQFSINGVSFGATSVDSLFHLKKEELTKRAVEVDAVSAPGESSAVDGMSSLCRHLLYQKRFCKFYILSFSID